MINQSAQAKFHAAAEHRRRIELSGQHNGGAAEGCHGDERLYKIVGVGRKYADAIVRLNSRVRQDGTIMGGVVVKLREGVFLLIVNDSYVACVFV